MKAYPQSKSSGIAENEEGGLSIGIGTWLSNCYRQLPAGSQTRVDMDCMRTLCLLFGWFCAQSLAWCAPTAPAASAPTLTRRVVQKYALTSANDFPLRDPQDWRLLASNDGGKTWVLLDRRQGEVFAERHQRRVFSIANQVAFNLYRLQIDRVREPRAADAVQLAEIEPLGPIGETQSPLPLFADALSAKGDNPPQESVQRAFDGRVETKWLDRATNAPATRASWLQWQYLDQSSLVITNVEQLQWLQARAAEDYPIRIEGVLAGRGSGTNQVFILDATGSVAVAPVEGAGDLLPGQHVRLEGRSRWDGKQVTVAHPALVAEGARGAAEPKRISPGQPVAPPEDFQWVEAEGVVRFVARAGTRLEFELVEHERSLSVHLLRLEQTAKLPPAGSRVRLRGICAGALDESGQRVAGHLWVAGLEAVSVLQPAENSAGPQASAGPQQAGAPSGSLLTDIRQIRRLSPEELARGTKVQLRGVMTEPFGSFIQQGADGIELLPPEGGRLSFPKLGAYAELEGETARGDARGAAIRVQQIRFLGEGKLPEPAHPSWAQLSAGQMNANWIEVEAVVRATDGSHLLLYWEGRQMMATIRSASVAQVKSLVDASIQLRGVCVNATDDRKIVRGIQLIVPSLDFVAIKEPPPNAAALPVRSISSLYRLGALNELNHRVKLKGTLTCQDGRKYFLQDADGSIMAVAKAEVVLSEQTRNSRWVFWQTPEDEGGSRPAADLKPGDQIEVVGFIESRGYIPMLTEATVRKSGSAEPIVPVKTTANDLAMGRLDSTVVSLEGTVLALETLGPHFVMQVQSDQRVFHAALLLKPAEPPRIVPGCVVRLTGVCQMEPASHAELGRTPAAFSLLLRTPADITLLEAPSWWTVERALGLVGALALVLVAAMVWIRLLHRRVEERTRQLQQEVAEHKETEQQLAQETKLLQKEIEEHRRTEASLARKTQLLVQEIDERKKVQAEVERIHRQLLSASRLAGMAEVATSVLHNVGNVLNSVNVLAAAIVSSVHRSKVPGVAQVAALLGRHGADLGRFITEDENGKHVPAHLERLGAHLLEEQKRLLQKAESLTENIQHIKEIVAMQQNYARVAGVREKLLISDIVEDALRMCNDSLVRHQIQVIRDYQELPPVTLDRHKVLQILFNLLDNAKHACELRRDNAGQVTVRLRKSEAGRLQLQVLDNGIGIPKENLPLIFTQGFSTRKGGHGFGLHGSILAAQDMGGSLTAQSDGSGAGAVFTLELPLIAEEVSAQSH